VPEDELALGDDPTRTLELELNLADVVRELRSALSELDIEDLGANLPQRKNILTYVAQITDAGLDGEAFVRYGCTHDIAVPLSLALAIDVWQDGPSPIGKRWVDALGIGSTLATRRQPERITAIGELTAAAFHFVCDWVYHAPFADIVSLNAPSRTTQRAIAESHPPAEDLTADYRWIADRLSAGSLDSWGLPSLVREYKWLRGHGTTLSLPEGVRAETPTTPEAVAIELADRNVLQEQPMSTLAPMTHQVQNQAKAFLHARRHTEAAALFEFMCEQGWLPEALCYNNRGFCLTPVDPRRSLRFLQRAARMGFSDAAINTYNQMCCMMALDDPAGLLDTAERYWCDQFEHAPVTAHLWIRSGPEWALTRTPDARDALATLALQIATREMRLDRVQRWEERLDALRRGEYFR